MAEASPLRLSVDAARPDDLFEDGAFPFRGPVLKESVQEYLLQSTRIARTVPEVELAFRFARSPTDEEQARFERELRAYYEVATEEVQREIRVNRVEGRRTFLLGLIGSVIALAIAIPTRLYLGFDFYIVEFLCVVVVWVLMWDAIEKLLWDATLLRMRYRAVRKLRDATVRYIASGIEAVPAR